MESGTLPRELRVENMGRTLEVAWPENRRDRLTAAQLRAACRCADCTRARADGAPPSADPEVAIRGVDPVGGYGVNLKFSDGHARGIFPWRFLRELADADQRNGDAITCSTDAAAAGSVATVESRRDDA
jgi:DUF971 family protein